MSILLAASRMAGALDGKSGALAIPGAAPPPPDPGSWVSQEQLDEYIAYVDALIRDMNAWLVNNEPLPPGAMNLHPSWVRFRIGWEKERDSQRDDNWYVSRDDYDTIKAKHRQALEFKKQFENNGIQFSPVVAKTEPVLDPSGQPVIDPATKQPVTRTTVMNVPDAPIRGTALPEKPPPKADDGGLSSLVPSRGTMVLLGGGLAAFLLVREYIRNR